MKVTLKEITKRLHQVLALSGANESDVRLMADMLLEYDLHQNTFSGLGELENAVEELKASVGKTYAIEVDLPSLKLINANGRSARLVGMEVVPMLCDMAKQNGIAMIGLHNGGYQGILETYSRAIAAEGLIGIVASNGGPQGVVPYGGRKDVLGTNPLSYGIPTKGMPIVFDGATAQYAYGSIKLAQRSGEPLAERSYLDKDGNWTTNAQEAISIIPFGGHKGYAINLLLDVMTGCLVRGKSGLQQQSSSELGSFQIAINPAAFGSLADFESQTSQLAADIEAVLPAEGFNGVYVPGYRGEEYKQNAIKEDAIDIADEVWHEFEGTYHKLTDHQ